MPEFENVLPPDLRDEYKGPPQTSHRNKIIAACWLVRTLTTDAINALKIKHQFDLCDPSGYLAGMADCCKNTIQGGEFFMSATHTALANGRIVQVMMQELRAKHDKVDLSEFVSGPLRNVFRDPPVEAQLAEFVGANEVRRAGAMLQGFPKPVNSYPNLAHVAYLANATPGNTSNTEGVHAASTVQVYSGKRNTTPHMLSCMARKRTPITAGLGEFRDDLIDIFHKFAYRLVLRHEREIRKVWAVQQEASEAREWSRMEKQLPA
jgi:hypothetical protein